MIAIGSYSIFIYLVLIVMNEASNVSYNQPKFCPNATWKTNATTFADLSFVGSTPYRIYVNTKNNVFVGDYSNHRIMMWVEDRSTPTMIQLEKIQTPNAIFVTINDDIYVGNQDDGNVSQHSLKTNITQATTKFDGACYGLFVDICDYLYCSMYSLHQVVKRKLDTPTTTPTVVAGKQTTGDTSTKLSNPMGVFVDINLNLYVADSGNHRIQLFRSNDLNGETVVGSTSSINGITLDHPSGIVLDGDKHLFIVDQHNHRIVGPEASGLRCLVGCNGKGSASNQFNSPRSLSFDIYGNIFVMDRENKRIQKFDLITDSCDSTTVTTSTSTEQKFTTSPSEGPTSTKTSGREASTMFETSMKEPSTVQTTKEEQVTTTVMIKTSSSITAITATSPSTQKQDQLTTEVFIKEDTSSAPTHLTVPRPPLHFFATCSNTTNIGPNCTTPGTLCDLLDPCLNNGSCFNIDTSPGYNCSCVLGFTGIQCQINPRFCQENTCWNGGTCNETSNCTCLDGWEGDHCERKINYCWNITCQNGGVCRPLFLNYSCECLGENYSGRFCELVAKKIVIYRIVSKSCAYIAIVAMLSVVMFVIVMDLLKYGFGIDPTRGELERNRREKRAKNRKPVIVRYIYVNAPLSSSDREIPTIVETLV